MKRKLLSLSLALCLVLGSVSLPAWAASDICFIALNENLMTIDNMAYSQNSVIYVPYSVFASFRIYDTYNSKYSIATLYNTSKQIYFDLSTGSAYDNEGNTFMSSAIMRNGTVFVPLSLVCSQFGLTWSYIYGSGTGDVCRIKDGGAILSDSQFLSSAGTLIAARYEQYMSTLSGTNQAVPTANPNVPTTPEPDEQEEVPVYLSFQGVPSDFLLRALSNRGLVVTFFLSAEDIAASPETVRRIVGEGHAVGILCSGSPEEDYAEASSLLFEAAKTKTLLIAASSSDYNSLCRNYAKENGLVFCEYDIDGVRSGVGIIYSSLITSYLPLYTDRADVRILCSDTTDSCIVAVLNFITKESYSVKPLTVITGRG